MPNTALGACDRAINKEDACDAPPPCSLLSSGADRHYVNYYTHN